eukprot:CAMPEP_0168587062 /NCGR_PEP_ID=MMETSP0420-20121227/4653_1 /TAXON_ID=498008 /ORGANISM="Pessonella sp." /LENGTH=180 /DNA_ID=CAMNT_0008622267 /DNA_START=34 /DNA_END=576 /DNA_ORIENTATION=-
MAEEEKANFDGYLLAAAKRGNISLLEQTLADHQDEVNVNCQDGVGNTPLHYSANWGHYETLEMLLNASANPNIKNFQDDTPLHRAFYKGSIPMIQLLLKYGANPRAVNKQGMQPGDYAQTPQARQIRDTALNATREKLRTMPPPVPARTSNRVVEGSDEPLDFSKLANMKVSEKDLDEDT